MSVWGLGAATRIYLAAGATDMRKGYNGLFGLVRDHLEQDPLSGHVYLFANRNRTRVKALYWDGSGLWVCGKGLAKGRFWWPGAEPGVKTVTLRAEELALLLGGLDLAQAKPRRWYRQAPSAA
ncbi:MAG: IS66 family insertion sequence element accessory protein TnpB [Terriglobales bacterium]